MRKTGEEGKRTSLVEDVLEALADDARRYQLVILSEDVEAVETTTVKDDNVLGVGVRKDLVPSRSGHAGSRKDTAILRHAQWSILLTLVVRDQILLEKLPVDHDGLNELTRPSKLHTKKRRKKKKKCQMT